MNEKEISTGFTKLYSKQQENLILNTYDWLHESPISSYKSISMILLLP